MFWFVGHHLMARCRLYPINRVKCTNSTGAGSNAPGGRKREAPMKRRILCFAFCYSLFATVLLLFPPHLDGGHHSYRLTTIDPLINYAALDAFAAKNGRAVSGETDYTYLEVDYLQSRYGLSDYVTSRLYRDDRDPIDGRRLGFELAIGLGVGCSAFLLTLLWPSIISAASSLREYLAVVFLRLRGHRVITYDQWVGDVRRDAVTRGFMESLLKGMAGDGMPLAIGSGSGKCVIADRESWPHILSHAPRPENMDLSQYKALPDLPQTRGFLFRPTTENLAEVNPSFFGEDVDPDRYAFKCDLLFHKSIAGQVEHMLRPPTSGRPLHEQTRRARRA